MPPTLNYGVVIAAHRETIDKALRSMGKHELADKLPVADRVMADIAWLLEQSATAFEEGRPLDGVTLAERALEPKWESAGESREALDAAATATTGGGGGW
jgi:hypothetical protein